MFYSLFPFHISFDYGILFTISFDIGTCPPSSSDVSCKPVFIILSSCDPGYGGGGSYNGAIHGKLELLVVVLWSDIFGLVDVYNNNIDDDVNNNVNDTNGLNNNVDDQKKLLTKNVFEPNYFLNNFFS